MNCVVLGKIRLKIYDLDSKAWHIVKYQQTHKYEQEKFEIRIILYSWTTSNTIRYPEQQISFEFFSSFIQNCRLQISYFSYIIENSWLLWVFTWILLLKIDFTFFSNFCIFCIINTNDEKNSDILNTAHWSRWVDCKLYICQICISSLFYGLKLWLFFGHFSGDEKTYNTNWFQVLNSVSSFWQ